MMCGVCWNNGVENLTRHMWRGAVLSRLLIQSTPSSSMSLLKIHQPTQRLFSTILCNSFRQSSMNLYPILTSVQRPSPFELNHSTPTRTTVRGFKNPKTKQKSRRTAVKRFIATGNGKLKRARCGKVSIFPLPFTYPSQYLSLLFQCHLTGHMSRVRKTRLNSKVIMEGTNLKNVKKLIL
jgi:ribosomal protein L35